MEHSNKKKSYWPIGTFLIFGFMFFVKFAHALSIIKAAAYKQLDAEKQKWLKSAIKYNYVMLLLYLILNLSPFFFIAKAVKSEKNQSKVNIVKLAAQTMNGDIKPEQILSYLPKEMRFASYLFVVSVLANLLIFLDPVLRKSLVLQRFMPSEEGKERVWTPIGVLINTYGSDLNSVLADKRTWTAINMATDKDYVFIHPKNEALAFFTKKIQLNKEYIFK